MSTPETCQRCAALASLRDLGPLRVCTSCVQVGLRPDCGRYQHDYRAGGPGWVCLRCGTTLEAGPPIVETPVLAAVKDWYC